MINPQWLEVPNKMFPYFQQNVSKDVQVIEVRLLLLKQLNSRSDDAETLHDGLHCLPLSSVVLYTSTGSKK